MIDLDKLKTEAHKHINKRVFRKVFSEWLEKYGDLLVAGTKEELLPIAEMLARGDKMGALGLVYDQMSPAEVAEASKETLSELQGIASRQHKLVEAIKDLPRGIIEGLGLGLKGLLESVT